MWNSLVFLCSIVLFYFFVLFYSNDEGDRTTKNSTQVQIAHIYTYNTNIQTYTPMYTIQYYTIEHNKQNTKTNKNKIKIKIEINKNKNKWSKMKQSKNSRGENKKLTEFFGTWIASKCKWDKSSAER